TDNKKKSLFKQPLTLLDSAAKTTALHYVCDELEAQHLSFDDQLWKKIAFWAFPRDESEAKLYYKIVNSDEQAWTAAVKFVEKEKMTDVIQVGFMVTATISDGRPYQVSLTFERCKIVSSTCSGCPKQLWCSHILAAVIYRIRNANQITVHAPMTESLSALSREQLQKLLQYHVAEDPGSVLGKLFKHFDAVRDVQSDMNQTQALPDPTIGLAEGISNTWQRSMEILGKRIIAELKRASILHDSRCCYHGPGETPAGCEKSTLDQHINKIKELMLRRDAKARQVLMVIAAATVKVMKENQRERYEAPDLDRFCHEIERLMRASVMNPSLLSIQHLQKLQTFLLKLYRETSSLKSNVVRHSQWIELPSVVPLLKGKDYITSVLQGEVPQNLSDEIDTVDDMFVVDGIGNDDNQGGNGNASASDNERISQAQTGYLFKEALCLATLRLHHKDPRILLGFTGKLVSFSVTLAALETLLLHGLIKPATCLAVKQLQVIMNSVKKDCILSKNFHKDQQDGFMEMDSNEPSTSRGAASTLHTRNKI
uniref:Zinc finger SWIM domain-containing protein 8-like n=1 Tax=Saccoglossus kowalevskii TaxID=10224 RepID=A0ABM0MDZ4_SACKO